MKTNPLLAFITALLGLSLAADVTFQTTIGLSSKANEIAQRAEWKVISDHFMGMAAAYDMGSAADVYAHFWVERQGGIGDWFAQANYLGTSAKTKEGRLGLYFPLGNMRFILGMVVTNAQYYPLFGVDYTWREWQSKIEWGSKIELGLGYTWGAAEESLADMFHILSPADGTRTNLSEILIRGYYLDRGKITLNGKELTLRADGLFSEKVSLPKWGPTAINIQFQGDMISNYSKTITVVRTPPYWDVPESRQQNWVPIIEKLGKEPRNLLNPTENVSRSEFFTLVGRLMDLDKKQYDYPRQFVDIPDSTLRNILTGMIDHNILKGKYPQFKPNETMSRKDSLLLVSRFLPVTPGMTVLELPDVPVGHWMASDLSKFVWHRVVVPSAGWLNGNMTRGDMMDLLSAWYPLASVPTNEVSTVMRKAPKSTIKFEVVEIDEPVPVTINKIDASVTAQMSEISVPFAILKKVLSVEKAPPMRETTAASTLTLFSAGKTAIVRAPIFTVRGKGPPGELVYIGKQHVEKIPQSGQFAVDLSLYPGLNTIGASLKGGDKQVINVIYLQTYQDLPPKDLFTPFFEKIGTMGYFPTSTRFEPSRIMTKRDFYKALINAGYGDNGDLETLGPLDQRMSYGQAVDVMQKMSGHSLSRDNSAAGDLTRRMFALLLYELPKVKAAMQMRFPDER